jgi:hypothetical protein
MTKVVHGELMVGSAAEMTSWEVSRISAVEAPLALSCSMKSFLWFTSSHHQLIFPATRGRQVRRKQMEITTLWSVEISSANCSKGTGNQLFKLQIDQFNPNKMRRGKLFRNILLKATNFLQIPD